MILGDPGAGKSTLLHYLALTHADKEVGDVLPIFVPLAAYDDYRQRNQSGLALADFLSIYYEQWRSLPGLAPLLPRRCRAGGRCCCWTGWTRCWRLLAAAGRSRPKV
ncbi:MAG: hypothetical protein H6641_09705 [Caldilineaceae bacterium]|nr:hypothetical protein [Caldilineaceae bacterium]